MNEAKRWPMDFDSITKGQDITAEAIETAYGVKRDTKEYAMKKLSLQKQIEDQMELRGITCTVRSCGDGLRVLTDAEASEYNMRETSRAIRKMGRCTQRISGVDSSDFDDHAKRVHDSRVHTVSTVYLAAKRAKHDAIRALPHVRDVPPMLAGVAQ